MFYTANRKKSRKGYVSIEHSDNSDFKLLLLFAPFSDNVNVVSYILIHQTEGRQQLLLNGINQSTDWVIETANRIVSNKLGET